MSKKIGIMTIYGGNNYGNKLQNYAMQTFLQKHGLEAETIRYTKNFSGKKYGIAEKLQLYRSRYFSEGFANSLWHIKRLMEKKAGAARIGVLKSKRAEQIARFEENRIVLSRELWQDAKELDRAGENYDYVVAGSDQVWNPYWQGAYDEFFLTFVPEYKRIAYAPSIGVASLPDVQVSRYTELLNGFSELSCRERTGASLIQELTGRECLAVVDPVFLLDASEWLRIAEQPQRKKYVLTYFLGDPNYKNVRKIRQYASKHGCEVLDLFDETTTKSLYANLEEFLGYIANAEIFFTDSFHGCAFATILKTQFVVCSRRIHGSGAGMGSRLDDLMERLGITERYIQQNAYENVTIDFEKVHEKLNTWKAESVQFFLKQLNREMERN